MTNLFWSLREDFLEIPLVLGNPILEPRPESTEASGDETLVLIFGF